MDGLKRKKILVTGATGFIGSHLVEKLSQLTPNVIATDIRIDEHSYFIKNGVYKNVTFEVLDVRHRDVVKDILIKFTPDYIIHLAAQTIVTTAFENPYETLETNIMGTVNILEEARRIPSIKRIIVASSDKAYGKTTEAYTEDKALRGDHPYDVSKSSADLICIAYFKTYNTPVVVTRCGNVYGEGDMHFDRIIPGICRALSENSPLEIRSNGKYVRDYLYVEDVVEGYISLVTLPSTIDGQAFNFASDDKLSVLELIKVAEKSLKKKVPYQILNIAKNEIPFQHLNDTKVRKLGWKSHFTVGTSLPKVFQWYDEFLRDNKS